MLTSRRNPLPPEDMEHDQVLQMRLSAEIKKMLDDLRRAEPDLPTRSEMIRRLIARAAQQRRGKQ